MLGKIIKLIEILVCVCADNFIMALAGCLVGNPMIILTLWVAIQASLLSVHRVTRTYTPDNLRIEDSIYNQSSAFVT